MREGNTADFVSGAYSGAESEQNQPFGHCWIAPNTTRAVVHFGEHSVLVDCQFNGETDRLGADPSTAGG